jgi:uncharacterized protein
MIVDLTTIEGSVKPFEFDLGPQDLELDQPGVKFLGPVHASGTVARTAAQVEVKGKVSGSAEIECTRCLEPVRQDLNFEFQSNFVAPEHFSSDKENEVAGEDLDTDVLESDRIDVNDVVREQIILNLPEQLFCKEDCKGLCPKCGANRNLIDCKCDHDEVDPRWAALKDFRS